MSFGLVFVSILLSAAEKLHTYVQKPLAKPFLSFATHILFFWFFSTFFVSKSLYKLTKLYNYIITNFSVFVKIMWRFN